MPGNFTNWCSSVWENKMAPTRKYVIAFFRKAKLANYRHIHPLARLVVVLIVVVMRMINVRHLPGAFYNIQYEGQCLHFSFV